MYFFITGSFLKPAKIATKGGNPIVAVLISWLLVQVSSYLMGSHLMGSSTGEFSSHGFSSHGF